MHNETPKTYNVTCQYSQSAYDWLSTSEFSDMLHIMNDQAYEKQDKEIDSMVDENPNLLTVSEMKEWMADL